VALLFGLSLVLTACNASNVREFLAELFPPPVESSGDEAPDDAGDASEEPSEDGAGEEGESGDAADDERCINRNEHRGSLRSPRLREERPNKNDRNNAGDEQSEPEDDAGSDEPAEQDEPDGAGNASEDDDRPAERQRRDRAPADDDSDEQEDSGGGQSSGLSGVEQQVFNLLNAERERAGLSPLQLDSTLSQGARAWSRRMATEGFFEHDTSGNFAENIAYGYPTPAAVHDGWMNSEGHRANRMNSRYTTYGVGVFEQGNTLYYTERFK
jgi:Cysteine-rich secretory protein family